MASTQLCSLMDRQVLARRTLCLVNTGMIIRTHGKILLAGCASMVMLIDSSKTKHSSELFLEQLNRSSMS